MIDDRPADYTQRPAERRTFWCRIAACSRGAQPSWCCWRSAGAGAAFSAAASSGAGALARCRRRQPARSPRNANYAIDARSIRRAARCAATSCSPGATVDRRRHEPAVPPLLQRLAQHAVHLDARAAARAATPTLAARPRDRLGLDRRHQPARDSRRRPPVDLTSRMRFIAPDDGNAEDRTVVEVPLDAPVAPGRDDQRADRLDVARAAHLRAHRRDRQLLLPRPVVSEARRARRHRLELPPVPRGDRVLRRLRHLRRAPDRAAGLGGRRHRASSAAGATTATARPRIATTRKTSTTSPGRRAPTTSSARATFEHADAAGRARCGCCCSPSTPARPSATSPRRARRSSTTASGSAPTPTATSPSSIRPGRAAPAAWSTRRSSPPARAGWRRAASTQPEGVTIHEAGHQFWYGIVATNEFEHAWMDEGLNTFSTARTIAAGLRAATTCVKRYFGGFVPWVFRDVPLSRAIDGNRLAGYRAAASSDDARPRRRWRYWPGTAGAITYNKTALWLHTLERMLGWQTLQRILSTYFARWAFKHPKPDDFFAVVNEVSGQDLTWFFDQVYRSSNDVRLRRRLAAERAGGRPRIFRRRRRTDVRERRCAAADRYRTTVVVRRHGEGIFPVDVRVVFENGEEMRWRWDGRDRWKLFELEQAVARAVRCRSIRTACCCSTSTTRTTR